MANIVLELKSVAIVSLGKFCDDGCTIELMREKMDVTKSHKSSYADTVTTEHA